jgi:hypothetical protein
MTAQSTLLHFNCIVLLDRLDLIFLPLSLSLSSPSPSPALFLLAPF